jgi:hypothetical protein
MTMHKAPKNPKPLEKQQNRLAWGIAAFLIALILIGWWVSIADVIKAGFFGARDGVEVIVDTGEDIKQATQDPLTQTGAQIDALTSTITETIETLEETKEVMSEVVEVLPQTIADHQTKEAQAREQKEAEITFDVLELTQEKLQAE